MKNLKKTVCMILALAMLLSLCAVSVGAISYTDESEITNREAVTVLSELAVLQGSQNVFRPADTLTRAEGCTIITKLLGHGDADGVSGFIDMADSAWAEGAVAYCKNIGIVCGVGHGRFQPKGQLTGTAFAKMLLCSLGYRADAESMTGSAWEVNTVKLAKQAGLLDSLAFFNGSAPISREDAAQMAFNALRAAMVVYSGGVQVENGNIRVLVSGSRSDLPAAGKDYRVGHENERCEFCEFYFPGLRYEQSAERGFGRPNLCCWTLNGKEIYQEDGEMQLLETYTETVKTGTLYDLVEKDTVDALKKGTAHLTVFLDGSEADVSVSDYFVKNGSKAAAHTGNGVQTEIYKDGDGNVTVVQINTWLAVAADDYHAGHDELDIDVFAHPVLGSETLSGDDFEITEYRAGDYLLIRTDAGEIAQVIPAEIAEGKLKGYTVGKSVTMNGSKFAYSSNFDTDSFAQDDFAINSDLKLVLDENGYILGLEASLRRTDFFVISEDCSVSMDENGDLFYTYDVIRDGAISTVDVDAPLPGTGLYVGGKEASNGYLDADSLQMADDADDGFLVKDTTDAVLTCTGRKLTVDEERYTLSDTCEIYLIDADGNAESCTVSRLAASAKSGKISSLFGVCDGSSVTCLYVVCLP